MADDGGIPFLLFFLFFVGLILFIKCFSDNNQQAQPNERPVHAQGRVRQLPGFQPYFGPNNQYICHLPAKKFGQNAMVSFRINHISTLIFQLSALFCHQQ